MKLLRIITIYLLGIILISWGQLGHRTIGLIAEHHLSQKAKAGIQNLLGTTSLSDVANWADEVRGTSEYRSTGPWHYINLPLGLDRASFDNRVKGMAAPNVYKALTDQEHLLMNPNSTREQKIETLKFIVHFVGDLHQPMHVSRAEDQGGNKVQVNYEGKGTNLHSLWDSRLLEHEGLSDAELATKIDKASIKQIKQWQNDPMLDWLWESYQVSTTLYAEIDALPKRTISDEYYSKHIGIAEERMEKAGVRLAGVLNQIFEDSYVNSDVIPAPAVAPEKQAPSKSTGIKEVQLSDIQNHIGEEVKVCGKVYGDKALSGMTLVNVGAAYPNQLLTVVLKGEAKSSWKGNDGKNICVTGMVIQYKGKPEIMISEAAKINVQ